MTTESDTRVFKKAAIMSVEAGMMLGHKLGLFSKCAHEYFVLMDALADEDSKLKEEMREKDAVPSDLKSDLG